jgi:F1F0 ATPase subunit 2
MNGAAAFLTGVGLGLVCFGSLWLTARRVMRCSAPVGVGAGRLARLALAGATFYGLGREGPDAALAGLAGFWIARTYLIRQLGGNHDQ